MATAILDFELDNLPVQVAGLERYPEARILVRIQGCPAAWVKVAVEQGYIMDAAILDALAEQADPHFWQLLAEHRVGKATAPAAPFPSATVAVCTRDRPEELLRCLEGLMHMHDDGQALLVVDSASRNEATRQVVARFPRVRYLRVDRPGLDVARNAALQAATGEFIAFIDDDAVPDPNWLRGHCVAFDRPLVMASMGLTLPLELETAAQELFEQYGGFSRGFAPLEYNRQSLSPLQTAMTGAGVNMALRRSVFDLVGRFDEALDAGTPTQSGGELELLGRVIHAGLHIRYTPAALNWHQHRRAQEELRRTLHGYGKGVYAFWTKRLVEERDATVPLIAAAWLGYDQLPDVIGSRLGIGKRLPWPLPWDQLRGCIAGPLAYVRARRQQRQSSSQPTGESVAGGRVAQL